MKKFLISSFTFIVAMLPLSLLSSSNDNANSADVNHDGEVNISDVNAVIDIILGGAHEGYSGDVNNDGETNISDINYLIDIILGKQTTAVPVINTQIVDNAVIITASGNGNVCLYVNGVMVTNPYVAIRGEVDYEVSVYATAQESGKLMSQSETINILIPALATTATPVITTETTNEAVIITATGNGNVNLYVDGVVVDNPYVAVRGEVDYEITVYATAQESGKLMSRCESIIVLIPAMPITATPVVTTNITEAAVIITASGDGIVKLYVNDLLVENPYTAIRSNVDYELTVYATAQEEGKVLSQSNNQTIIVPALENNETETFTVNGVSFTMVNVDGGTFTMGSNYSNDNQKPAHEVTLSSYSLGQTEVTQALWQAVMGTNPSCFTGNLNRPVEQVSWNDCQTFISKLNSMTGKSFRLPTEAEWEFAARGGNKSQGYKFAGSNTIGDVAWYIVNAGSGVGESSADYGTHVVGSKAPNELGFYDMSGNVWEWCNDWFSNYNEDAQTNPMGPTSGSERVRRGGSWVNLAGICSVSYRVGNIPTGNGNGLGMRLALGPTLGPTPDEHDWVDLGLPSGTLWATMNVGASSPEEFGDYFAWGETAPKNKYSWNTYKWCNGSENTLTKYCTESSYGTVDNKTELELEDDAAYVNWGPLWRMPSMDQQEELRDMCTWQWTTRNGVNGYLITGPNGGSLFLPAAGVLVEHGNQDIGSCGYYWSHSLYEESPSNVGRMYYYSGGMACGYRHRSFGMTVRPVRVSQN